MDLIKQLTESKMISTPTAYRKYTGKQVAELAYMHILALRILASEHSTARDARDYARKTIRTSTHFGKWMTSGTDLYLLMYALMSEDPDLRMPDSSKDFLQSMYLDEHKIRTWLGAVGFPTFESLTSRLFLTLDTQFHVRDSTLKSIRRLVMDWPELDHRERQLAITRLLQLMRARSTHSDLLTDLQNMAKANHYELYDVCDLETGEGCDMDEAPKKDTPKKLSTMTKVTAIATGAYLGSKISKKLSEDDGGAVAGTVAADIAPLVKPLGKLQRRPSPGGK